MKYLYRRNASTLKCLRKRNHMLITFDEPLIRSQDVDDGLTRIVSELLNLEGIYWGHHIAVFVDFKKNEWDEIYDRNWWITGFTLVYDPFELEEEQYKDLAKVYKLRSDWDEHFYQSLPQPGKYNLSRMLTEKTEILEV